MTSTQTAPTPSQRRQGFVHPGPLPSWTHALAYRCYLIAIFLVPMQLEIDAFKAVIESRFPPGDVVLALAVLLAPTAIRISRSMLGMLPLALLATLAYGVVVSLLRVGDITTHALYVKFIGATVLTVLGLLTISYTRIGRGDEILRAFVTGMVLWGVVAYIDIHIVDLVPWIAVDVESRFGGMQFDPNNAGAGYGITAILIWRYGQRLYDHRVTWLLSGALATTFFGLSLSRGAFIGMAVAAIVTLLVDRVSAQRMLRAAFVALIGFITLGAMGWFDSVIYDFQRRPDNVGSRNELTAGAIDGWVDSGGVGMGLGTYRDEAGEIVHNTSIWLLTEMSVVGVAFFLAMVMVPFVACLRLRRQNYSLAMSLMAAHVLMTVASIGIEAVYQRPWWIIIGVMAPVTAHNNTAPVTAHNNTAPVTGSADLDR